MSNYPVEVQLRTINDSILYQEKLTKGETWELLEESMQKIHDKIGNAPEKSALIFIVNGRAVRVQSAPDVLNHSMRRENGSAGYAVSMAQYVFDMRNEPQYALIPPVLHFQKLYFGADSDGANIACAAMINRLIHEISADRREEASELQSEEAQEELFWREFYELEEIHGEIGDTNIRESIYEEFTDRCKEQAHWNKR